MKGTYLLLLQLEHELNQLPVGKLGQFSFAPGYYVYIGSAFGSGGLPARLAYHLRRVKTHPHWHVDYLRLHATLVETWAVHCVVRLEDAWVTTLAHVPELSSPIKRFGASDTAHMTHLFYARQRPSLRLLTTSLLGALEFVGLTPCDMRLEISTHEC